MKVQSAPRRGNSFCATAAEAPFAQSMQTLRPVSYTHLGAQRDGAVHGFCIKVLGAAFHPKLIDGAVVQHKAGLACSNGRAGIATLDAVQAGAAKTVYHAAVAALSLIHI